VLVPEGDDVASGGRGVAGGGLIGMLIGVLGGPLGVLLGGYAAILAGGVGAVVREEDRDVALDAISKQIEPGHTVLVAEVGELATEVVDDIVGPLEGTVTRRPLRTLRRDPVGQGRPGRWFLRWMLTGARRSILRPGRGRKSTNGGVCRADRDLRVHGGAFSGWAVEGDVSAEGLDAV
jgi:hypothetical protein